MIENNVRRLEEVVINHVVFCGQLDQLTEALTEREFEVTLGLVQGLRPHEIGRDLELSKGRINRIIDQVQKKARKVFGQTPSICSQELRHLVGSTVLYRNTR